MFAIVLTVCSVLHGAACKEQELVSIDEGQSATPYGCMIGGMHQVIEWSALNPNWSVRRWECRPAGHVAKI